MLQTGAPPHASDLRIEIGGLNREVSVWEPGCWSVGRFAIEQWTNEYDALSGALKHFLANLP